MKNLRLQYYIIGRGNKTNNSLSYFLSRLNLFPLIHVRDSVGRGVILLVEKKKVSTTI